MDEVIKLKKKIVVLQAALKKQNSWYTGLSIKRYIRREVFKLQTPEFSNPAINSGRWSAYCHYSQVKAFENLLEKHQIGLQSPVIVHPLLPEYLVDILKKKEVEIIFLDIDKTTLSFNKDQILPQIQAYSQVKPIELIIHYGFNGLYEEIIEIIDIAQNEVVPSMFVCDNFDLNLSLLELFNKLKLGSVLWVFGDSFLDDQLSVVLDTLLETQPWFVSWFLESRTKSVLEYHLSESKDLLVPLVQAYAYLLVDKVGERGIIEKVQRFITKQYFFRKIFQNSQQAMEIIKENYEKLYESAIPDLVFDLQTKSPERFTDAGKPEELIYKSGELQNKAKDLYDHFLKKLPETEQGNLEIPNYYLDRSYLKYFLYTTEVEKWTKEMEEYGFFSETLPALHSDFKANPRLPNANFVSDYGFFVDVFSGLEF